jgi:hypothetical protein
MLALLAIRRDSGDIRARLSRIVNDRFVPIILGRRMSRPGRPEPFADGTVGHRRVTIQSGSLLPVMTLCLPTTVHHPIGLPCVNPTLIVI